MKWLVCTGKVFTIKVVSIFATSTDYKLWIILNAQEFGFFFEISKNLMNVEQLNR